MAKDDELFTEERRRRIVAMVGAASKVTVSDLAARFGVSGATVRADLRALHGEGFLTRTHGGAIPRGTAGSERSSSEKATERLEEKRRAARAAAELVADGDTIILDTGTTTLELARLIRDRFRGTVVTNDWAIARTLEDAEAIKVILLGGTLRRGFHCTVGPAGREMLTRLKVDKAFMGANGFSPEAGATTPDQDQAETKRSMVAAARQVILVCDSSKIGRVSFVQFASCAELDFLATDSVPPSVHRGLKKARVCVLLPPRE
jgi:DeoR family fructose operon transcriptional repressor